MNVILYIPPDYQLIQYIFEHIIDKITITNKLSDDVNFAIIPVTCTEDERSIKNFIERSIFPIVLSDTAILFADSIYHIGYNIPEIIKLQQDIFAQPERCLATFHAQNTVMLDQLTFPENYQTQFALTIGNDLHSEYPLCDKRGFLLDETDLFISIWENLAKQFPKTGNKKVLFFGAGKFLIRLLATNKYRDVPNILGATDDSITEKKEINGLTIYPTNELSGNEFNSIFLATDSLIELFSKRCQTLFGKNIPILTINNYSQNSIKHTLPLPQKIVTPTCDTSSTKLQAIIVCVNYSDILSWTLPFNKKMFDSITIVTSSEDKKTQQVAKENGATIVISDSYKRDGANFNKGAMLNAGYSTISKIDWCVVTDADIIFRENFKINFLKKARHSDALYYALRLDTPSTNKEKWLRTYEKNPELIKELTFNRPGANKMPWGYMQLFHPQSCFLDKNKPFYPDHFTSAVDVDYAFQEKWESAYKVLLPETVIHIEHGTEGSNWNGRKSTPLSYKKI
jgi:hypothetical protein